MCGIFGVAGNPAGFGRTNLLLKTAARGRDGYGVHVQTYGGQEDYKTPGRGPALDPYRDPFLKTKPSYIQAAIGNFRAEPTTEIVPIPTDADQQPYRVGGWTIVHNGVIANDRELCARYEFTPPTRIDSWVIAAMLDYIERERTDLELHEVFEQLHLHIRGSFAILAMHDDQPGRIFYMTDYRPLYYKTHSPYDQRDVATVVSSVNVDGGMQLVQPYSWGTIENVGLSYAGSIRTISHARTRHRTLVVLSGGLDSTTVAAMCHYNGDELGFLHFDYGCRATTQERTAVEAIARHYGAPLEIINMDSIFAQIGGSRLTGTTSQISNGEAGAEQAIEWVPARNTILASVAMGIAEAKGYDLIALGINLEESGGGYTDNVIDLYDGLNSLSQWIVGYGKRVQFISPVGSMMKHEIVKAGVTVGAPFHLTWSCYNAGNRHCGNCGPCIMRLRAFERNGLKDPVFECEGIDL